ncbi:MAG: ATP-binding cassette domain-containing protein [Eubacterium sp.]|jgi:ABC-2 type transport system ATP-binding protein|nr:ATP-binding cassette domain-containing protein [Eubacterium sp.]
MIIEIKNYTKRINKTEVLGDIKLQLLSGSVYGLKGKNGSGKTMLMRAIAGLITPSEGYVSIDGQILGKDIDFPSSIGALIERPAFIDYYTGKKNLELVASIQHRISKDEIRTALISVGLDPNDKRTYKKYSLGMKQRLGIACAIMGAPEIIILDEPFNGIDDAGVDGIRSTIASLKENNRIIILACHDSNELDDLSDVIFTIKGGKIVEVSKTCKEPHGKIM